MADKGMNRHILDLTSQQLLQLSPGDIIRLFNEHLGTLPSDLPQYTVQLRNLITRADDHRQRAPWTAMQQLDFTTGINFRIYRNAFRRGFLRQGWTPPSLLYQPELIRTLPTPGLQDTPAGMIGGMQSFFQLYNGCRWWRFVHSTIRRWWLRAFANAFRWHVAEADRRRKWTAQQFYDWALWFDRLWYMHDSMLSPTDIDRTEIDNPARPRGSLEIINPDDAGAVAEEYWPPSEDARDVLNSRPVNLSVPAPVSHGRTSIDNLSSIPTSNAALPPMTAPDPGPSMPPPPVPPIRTHEPSRLRGRPRPTPTSADHRANAQLAQRRAYEATEARLAQIRQEDAARFRDVEGYRPAQPVDQRPAQISREETMRLPPLDLQRQAQQGDHFASRVRQEEASGSRPFEGQYEEPQNVQPAPRNRQEAMRLPPVNIERQPQHNDQPAPQNPQDKLVTFAPYTLERRFQQTGQSLTSMAEQYRSGAIRPPTIMAPPPPPSPGRQAQSQARRPATPITEQRAVQNSNEVIDLTGDDSEEEQRPQPLAPNGSTANIPGSQPQTSRTHPAVEQANVQQPMPRTSPTESDITFAVESTLRRSAANRATQQHPALSAEASSARGNPTTTMQPSSRQSGPHQASSQISQPTTQRSPQVISFQGDVTFTPLPNQQKEQARPQGKRSMREDAAGGRPIVPPPARTNAHTPTLANPRTTAQSPPAENRPKAKLKQKKNRDGEGEKKKED